MAEFLTTNAISSNIENIIKNAKTELYLLMPYLQLSGEFYDVIKEASDRGVSIIIIYANEDLYTEEKDKLSELINLEVYNFENINAKCCCSENSFLFTSMDLHQFTVNYNSEMGIIFDKNKDNDLYKNAYNEIKKIISSSRNMNLHRKPVELLYQPSVKLNKVFHGFCIRCAMPISYNIGSPYCRNCTSRTDLKSDKPLVENFCHVCGSEIKVTAGSPLCERCKMDVM